MSRFGADRFPRALASRDRFAILLDGAFVLTKLKERLRRQPSADDVVEVCERILAMPEFPRSNLLRIYYYDARPATEQLSDPIDGSQLDLGATSVHRHRTQLLSSLELKPDFALRLGEAGINGWEVGKLALRSMLRSQRQLQARDLVPNVTQKGVDLRIGIDIARVALSGSVGRIVAVTGDSDMVPAFKFARREGIRVYLDTMGHGVRRSLKVHCDREISVCSNVAS